MNRGLCHFTGRVGLLLCALTIIPAEGQIRGQLPSDAAPLPPAPAQFDPSDVYFQGYLLSKEAEELANQKKFSKSLEKYQQAQQLFNRIHTYFPTWRTEMLETRQGKTQSSIDQVAPEALKEQDRTKASLAEFEGGRQSNSPGGAIRGGSNQGEIDSLATSHIADLEHKVRDLQQKLRETNPPNPTEASRDDSRVFDISRQRDLLQSELQQAKEQLTRQRAQFEQPMHEEVDKLNDRIKSLANENAVTAQALSKSRQEAETAKAQVDALQRERLNLQQQLSTTKQELSNTQEALKLERKTSNEVVEGQHKQILHFQEALAAKDQELQNANSRITHLENQLNEVQASFHELGEERDGLLREREQLSALLKLNENGQLRAVIDQNVGLAKQLREADEKMKRMAGNTEQQNQDFGEALNDLVVAKTTINDFKRAKASQDKRIADLESRLRSEDKGLAENSTGDPAEADVLRKIIQKQLRQQDRRRESRELLMQSISEQAKKDPNIASALDLFNAAEIPLTADELKYVDGHPGIIINSPVDESSEKVGASIASLERSTAPYKSAAQRAFTNEHLESARELLEMASQANPGDIQAICSLGVVNLRLGNAPGAGMAAVENFRRAVELESRNPYAQRMLGHSLIKAGSEAGPTALGEAEAAFKQACVLAPTDADNHLILGNFFIRQSRYKEAEDELKTAIACDDTLPEPYYNLAILCAQQGKKKQGLEAYNNALTRSSPAHLCEPDFELERQLGKTPS